MKLLFLNCLFQAGDSRVCHVVRGHEWYDLGRIEEPRLLAIQMCVPLIKMWRGRMRVDIETIFTQPRRGSEIFILFERPRSISTWRIEPVRG